MSKVGVIGLGAVGLPIATIFGLHFDVVGIDKEDQKVRGINDGVYWGYLEGEIEKLLPRSKLTASTDLRDIEDRDVVVLTLPTDSYDFSGIERVLLEIDGFYDKPVIISSTVRPGFTREIQKKCQNIVVSYVPIRTFEGRAGKQFFSMPKLIGTFDIDTYEEISTYYRRCGCETVSVIPPEKVELAKLFSNAFRQTELAIANELGHMAQLYGFDPEEIFHLVNEGDPYRYLKTPGIWGGYCLPKDTGMMIECAKNDHGYLPKILSVSEEIRRETIERKAQEILSLGKNLTVGIEGVTSKPIEERVPDVRESPVLEVIKILVNSGVNVKIYDPNLPEDELKMIARILGVQAASKQEIRRCDVYARHERYNLRIVEVKRHRS